MTKEEITKTINECQYRHTGMGDEYAICSLCCEPCIEAVNREKCKTLKELSYELKAINRSIMDENTLIGFNMAVALFNKHFANLKEEKAE